jgi:GNAT superfamily N-acetyltransferase
MFSNLWLLPESKADFRCEPELSECLPNVGQTLRDPEDDIAGRACATHSNDDLCRALSRIDTIVARCGRVPLMGVLPEHQNSRLAFMMIEHIRRWGVEKMGVERAEVGWILDDNQGMVAIANAIEGEVKRVHSIYEKGL